MVELTITSAMDPLFMWFAKEANIPLDEYASQAGGEGIANLIELVLDQALEPLATKIVNPLIGAGLASYVLFGKPPSIRLRRELLAVAQHCMWRVVDPSPRDVIRMAENAKSLVEGIQKGDAGMALSGIFVQPAEFGAMFKSLGVQMQVPGAPAPTAPAITPLRGPAPAPIPPAPAPPSVTPAILPERLRINLTI